MELGSGRLPWPLHARPSPSTAPNYNWTFAYVTICHLLYTPGSTWGGSRPAKLLAEAPVTGTRSTQGVLAKYSPPRRTNSLTVELGGGWTSRRPGQGEPQLARGKSCKNDGEEGTSVGRDGTELTWRGLCLVPVADLTSSVFPRPGTSLRSERQQPLHSFKKSKGHAGKEGFSRSHQLGNGSARMLARPTWPHLSRSLSLPSCNLG